MKPKILDCFAGIGGFSLAAQWAGFETEAFVEIEPFCQKVLGKNFPGRPIHSDIREFDAKPLRGRISVVCGGFPCQGISLAGNGEGLGTAESPTDRSGLWYKLLRVITECRPDFCLIENVPALRGRGIDTVLGGLEEAGYSCEPFVVGAKDIGATHQRDRCWIVAHSIHQPNIQTHSTTSTLRNNRYSRNDASRSDRSQIPTLDRTIPKSLSIGVDDGFPHRVDRNRSLGNAIVPGVAYLFLKWIMHEFVQRKDRDA